MSLQVEKLEKNMAKLTVEVPAEQFEKALKTSYNKNKSKFNVPGFRRGKAPQALIEKMYGPGVLYEDAVDEVLNSTYGPAVDESGLEVVSRPEISVEKIEKGQTMVYTALVAVKPAVTLGEYKGIEVERAKPEVTDADVDAELKKVQDQNSRLVSVEDRAVENGDQTLIDFDGYVDGAAFEGGKAEDYPLTIGSHSFIDTFEEQLVGKQIGEEVEVHVTFPEEYHAKELAGKPALFKVTVKEIKAKELPELDDEFAEEVSEFSTLEEYKADIRAKLADTKQKQATTENENNVVDKVVANASMDIPEPMIQQQVRNMIEEQARRMQSQGLSFEQYLQFTGTTIDQMEDQMRPFAEKRIRNRLVLEEVARQENIQITDEAVEEELKKMAESYGMELDQVKEFMGEDGRKNVMEDLAVQEAIDFLVAEAKLV
ncbi:MAG: trigger factor [Lachnospiraceae bacterium]|jgi:trigger factor|nr:trigger factor [Lachnospiraceae bacterium]